MSGYPSEVPGVTSTGVQRALGERRRRRMAERGGHVDLDATMSSWPTPDPPSRPRPVVRPRRALPGGGDRPVLPTPSGLVMVDLVEHAPPPSVGGNAEGSRRSRRGDTGSLPPVRTRPAAGADPFALRSERAGEPPSQPHTRVPPPPRPSVAQGGRTEPVATPPDVIPGRSGATRAPRRGAAVATPFGSGPRMRPGQAGTAPGGMPELLRPGGRVDAFAEEPTGRLIGRRRTLLIVAGIVAALLVITVGVLALRRQPGTTAALLPPNDAPRQTTALVGVLADDGTIAHGALLALDEDSLSSFVVPGALTVDVPDAGEMTLAESIKVDADAPDRGVEDTLGVRVDGTWVLDRAVLAELVDASGGIVMDVGAQLVAGDVTIPAGPAQRLTGAQAGVYALAVVDGESPDVAVARFNQVILGLLAVMPREPDRVTQLISSTERNTSTTITSEELATLLAGASQRIADRAAVPATVPVTAAADGGSAVVIDDAGMRGLVTGELAGSALPVATVGPLRVALQDGVGMNGLVTAARDRLVANGLRYGGGGDSEEMGETESVILVPADTAENRLRGEAVATALGLRTDSLAVLPPDQITTGVDIIVVLGQDFADLTGSGPT